MAYLAMDVGGTTIKTALVSQQGEFLSSIYSFSSKSEQEAEKIIANFNQIIYNMDLKALELQVPITGMSMGFPGPFDYQNGICLLKGINKFDSIYGYSLRTYLQTSYEIKFTNDADLYCIGECLLGEGKPYNRIMCICIGTGIGSGFFAEGKLIKEGESVPKDGFIYNTPYGLSIADHYISASGLRRRMKEKNTLKNFIDVKELSDAAEQGNAEALELFFEFGTMLAEIVMPFAEAFHADALIVGGNVAKSFSLYSEPLFEKAKKTGIDIVCSKQFSDLALLAAPLLWQ